MTNGSTPGGDEAASAEYADIDGILATARAVVATHPIPGIPNVDAVRDLKRAEGVPFAAGGRIVLRARIPDSEQHSEGYKGGLYVSAYHVRSRGFCEACEYDRLDYDLLRHEDTDATWTLECARCGNRVGAGDLSDEVCPR